MIKLVRKIGLDQPLQAVIDAPFVVPHGRLKGGDVAGPTVRFRRHCRPIPLLGGGQSRRRIALHARGNRARGGNVAEKRNQPRPGPFERLDNFRILAAGRYVEPFEQDVRIVGEKVVQRLERVLAVGANRFVGIVSLGLIEFVPDQGIIRAASGPIVQVLKLLRGMFCARPAFFRRQVIYRIGPSGSSFDSRFDGLADMRPIAAAYAIGVLARRSIRAHVRRCG